MENSHGSWIEFQRNLEFSKSSKKMVAASDSCFYAVNQYADSVYSGLGGSAVYLYAFLAEGYLFSFSRYNSLVDLRIFVNNFKHLAYASCGLG